MKSIKQLSGEVGISVQALRVWAKLGKLRAEKVGGAGWIISEEEFKRVVELIKGGEYGEREAVQENVQ